MSHRVFAALVWETLRHARATWLFWVLLGVTLAALMVVATVSLDSSGRVSLLGGLVPLNTDAALDGIAQLQSLQVGLALGVAGAGGTFVAVIGSASFVPEFLQPCSSSVLLVKPVPRWGLILGRIVGVLAFITALAGLFVVGTWMILGVRVGMWSPGYLCTWPLLMVQFLAVYAVSVLVGVLTRSSVASAFGSLLFWLVCGGSNYAHHATLAMPIVADRQAESAPALKWTTEAAYWALPKPVDILLMLDQTINHGRLIREIPEFEHSAARRGFLPALSVMSTLTFAFLMIALAVHQFQTTDY